MNQPSSPPPSDVPSFTPPKWVNWLIALTPVFPPLYLAALVCLGQLRILPLVAQRVLFYFAITQLLAALFTPNPLLSVGLATARTVLILAMIAVGVYLKESHALRPLLWGQLLIFCGAWIYTLSTQGWGGVQERLGHPYYYIVSLGLVAVVALWITLYWKGGGWWRWPVASLALVTFAAAGSRGPLLALVFGSLAAIAFSGQRRRWWAMLPAAIVLVSSVVTTTFYIPIKPLERLLNEQTSGREYVWKDSWLGWRTSPIGGVGPYQGGPYLTYLYKDGCHLTPTLERNKINCSEALTHWASAWLIAHNAWLHWLLETGSVGTSGLLVIMAYALWRTVQLGDAFVLAIFFGYLAMNIVDVVIAIPSQHFAELWWVTVGISFSGEGKKIWT